MTKSPTCLAPTNLRLILGVAKVVGHLIDDFCLLVRKQFAVVATMANKLLRHNTCYFSKIIFFIAFFKDLKDFKDLRILRNFNKTKVFFRWKGK